MRRTVAIALGFLVALPAVARDTVSAEGLYAGSNIGLGPISTRSYAIGKMFFPGPDVHFPLARGTSTWRVDTTIGWANIFNLRRETDRNYIIDGEWLLMSFGVSREVHGRWRLGMVIPIVTRFGGSLDSEIERFHDSLGIGNSKRDQFPPNRVRVEYDDEQGQPRNIDDKDSTGLSDIRVFATYLATHGAIASQAVELFVTAGIPTGDNANLEGAGMFNLGVGARLSRRLLNRHWYSYATLLGVYAFGDDFRGIKINQEHFWINAAIEYRVSSTSSALLQVLSSTAWARDFGEFSKGSTELALGGKWIMGNGSILELALIENLFQHQNSPDIGLHVTWTSHF